MADPLKAAPAARSVILVSSLSETWRRSRRISDHVLSKTLDRSNGPAIAVA
jgi:hypothetical protein